MSEVIISDRKCKVCHQSFPNTEEHFPPHTVKGKRYLRSCCRECWRKNRREYAAKEESKELKRQSRKRYFNNNKERIRELKHESHLRCREKNLQRSKRWHEMNRDYVRQLSRTYYKKHRGEILKRSLEYQRDNPEYVRARWHRRRAHTQQAGGSFTAAELREQFKRQRGRCYWCGDKLNKDNYHADHVIPLSRGGHNSIDNIVCACPICNLSKSNKLPHEWDGTDRLL